MPPLCSARMLRLNFVHRPLIARRLRWQRRECAGRSFPTPPVGLSPQHPPFCPPLGVFLFQSPNGDFFPVRTMPDHVSDARSGNILRQLSVASALRYTTLFRHVLFTPCLFYLRQWQSARFVEIIHFFTHCRKSCLTASIVTRGGCAVFNSTTARSEAPRLFIAFAQLAVQQRFRLIGGHEQQLITGNPCVPLRRLPA